MSGWRIMVTVIYGDPYGIRTRVAAVKGRCPRPLDEGVIKDKGVYYARLFKRLFLIACVLISVKLVLFLLNII